MTDFIEKKRQMFLVQMSLDTKRAEIRKLEEQAQQREEALKKSEEMLKEDESRFETFLKSNDQKAVEAIRKAEQETKMKQDKVQEIKKLNAQIASIKSEMAKYEESLEECQAYKKFLDDLTPPEYVREQLELHEREREEKRAARKADRRLARAAEDRAAEERLAADLEAMRVAAKGRRPDPKAVQAREAEHAAAQAALARAREGEDAADDAWDPDEGVPFEVPMYFTRPQQLLDIFAALEERNLFLIQNSQETEEQLEELKQKLEATKARMDEDTGQLAAQIAALQASIAAEEARAAALRQRANPARPPAGAAAAAAATAAAAAGAGDTEAQLAALGRRVAEVYDRLPFEPDSSLSTLMMLTNMEARLEEYLAVVAGMPPEEVERAEKDKERERRLRLRGEKLAAQRRLQEERIAKSIERSKAPVHRAAGRPVVFRAPPLVARRRRVEVREERDPDEEDLREFLAE
jgi:hypothetical protein